MNNTIQIKKEFSEARQRVFEDSQLIKDSFRFCVQYSLLVEEYLFRIASRYELPFAIASVGSFSRRELSPYSDIDVMIISPNLTGSEDLISKVITDFWDCGIEVSHTVREFPDIEKFAEEDLHAFTQFFETRFIIGNDRVYADWSRQLLEVLNEDLKRKLIVRFFDDIRLRYNKYGDSPKVLEPNVKFSAGGLRDLHAVEWIYSIQNNIILTDQNEITQTESFLSILRKTRTVNLREIGKLLESYKLILNVRNLLHLNLNQKNDRLEFSSQEAIAKILDYPDDQWMNFMKHYFEASTIIHRFIKTLMKRFDENISVPVSDKLSISIDDDFTRKGDKLLLNEGRLLGLPEIIRAYYYRAYYEIRFDEKLRSIIIESVHELEETQEYEQVSSVFFREILKLPRNVGTTLASMNETGVLAVFLPEFKEMIGFFQPGVYHCYTADEHTIVALRNLESIHGQNSHVGKLFTSLKEKDILYLAVIFHDIAKPISVSGHEILGGEIANLVMERLGYEPEEIALVQFLVRHHLTMEQTAFRRNLNDPVTLDNFAEIFPSVYALQLLYLLTYADLSAVSPAVWTQWKSDLLFELYRKTLIMLSDRVSGEEFLHSDTKHLITNTIAKAGKSIKKHIESIDDIGYLQNFSEDEINEHVEEIERGTHVSVFFKEVGGFTNITVITKDISSLLYRLCGTLSINDLNIHDAQIFTRKDGIVIDSFNVTDFRTGDLVDQEKYDKIKDDLTRSVLYQLQINKEFNRVRTKWWRLESKLFSRKSKIKIEFEKHDKYTIIDVYSPDRLGLLYQITKKMNELGLSIYFAKIATKADDVVDAFYILNSSGKKVPQNQYELIKVELIKTIEEML